MRERLFRNSCASAQPLVAAGLDEKNQELKDILQNMQQPSLYELQLFKLKDQLLRARDESIILSSLLYLNECLPPLSFIGVNMMTSAYGINEWVICKNSKCENESTDDVNCRLTNTYHVEQAGKFYAIDEAVVENQNCNDIAIALKSANGYIMGWMVWGFVNKTEKSDTQMIWLKEVAEMVCIKMADLQACKFMENSAEIMQREVNKQTAELKEINQSLELFAATISHDLRAPLRIVSGYIGLLKESMKGKMDEESAMFMGCITDANKRMGELIGALLRLAGLSKQVLKKKDFDLQAVIKMLVCQLQLSYPNHLFHITIDVKHKVYADPVLLSQVFENLISNAFKYSSKRELIKVEIKQQAGVSENVFTITDNGAGFDCSYADKLFKPFGRLHTTCEFEGNGVGLASCKWIINAHGGKITANGLPDKGATFTFTLPFK